MNLKKHLNEAVDQIPRCTALIISIILTMSGITLETINENEQSTIIARFILIFMGAMIMVTVAERDKYKQSTDDWKESFDVVSKWTMDYFKKKKGRQ